MIEPENLIIMAADLTFDRRYWQSVAAICKIVCLLCTFIGFICVVCSATVRPHNLRGAFYLAVAAVAFLSSSCLLLAGLFQLWQRKFHNLNAPRYEMFLNGFLAFIVFVAAAASCSMDVPEYTLATFFGFFAACMYAYEAYLDFHLSRRCTVATQTQIV